MLPLAAGLMNENPEVSCRSIDRGPRRLYYLWDLIPFGKLTL